MLIGDVEGREGGGQTILVELRIGLDWEIFLMSARYADLTSAQ